MREADIRGQIAIILAGVSGMGVVHEYQRWAATWEKFLDHFKDADNKINGCCISRAATPAFRKTMPTIEREHKYMIRCYYGLNDAAGSELIFQALVEGIQNEFDSGSNYSLGGYVLNSGPLQVRIIEPRMFGGVLCHFAELELPATERVTYS